MTRRCARAATLALGCLLLSASMLTAQALRGTLVRMGSTDPVVGADLVLRTLAGSAVARSATDNAGRFMIEFSGSGHFRLIATHADYSATSVPLVLQEGLELEFDLEAEPRSMVALDTGLLPPPRDIAANIDTVAESGAAATPDSVVPLSPIRVQSRAARPGDIRRGTSVTLITREQIEQRRGSARHVGDLVRTMPGISVREGATGGIPRGVCIESDRRPRRVAPVAPMSSNRRCQMVKVYIDDYPVHDPGAYLTMLHLNDVESVEFITPMQAVARYGSDASGGVLLISTRIGGPK